MKIERATKILTKALRDDADFYYGYQANIAMSFYDCIRGKNETKADWCNRAAKRFLDMWIKE